MSRQQYEMSQEQLGDILDACSPVPYVAIHCGTPSTPRERANAAWVSLGEAMGFDGMTAKPVPGRSNRVFTAVALKEKKS